MEVADALADLVYVIYGAALEYGIPLDRVFAEVHRSNMAKLGADGRPILREDGKILKPDGWTLPNVAAAMRESSLAAPAPDGGRVGAVVNSAKALADFMGEHANPSSAWTEFWSAVKELDG